MEDLLDFVKNLKNGYVSISYRSNAKLPKYLGLGVVEKETKGVYNFGTSYEKSVNNRLNKKGCPADFESEKRTWGHYLEGYTNKIVAHKESLYLHLSKVEGTKSETRYVVNGHPATEAELSVIYDYLKQHPTESRRQAEAGLGVKEQAHPFDVAFDNIISLKQGSMIYER